MVVTLTPTQSMTLGFHEWKHVWINEDVLPQGQGVIVNGGCFYLCMCKMSVSWLYVTHCHCDTLRHIATHCGVSVSCSCNRSKINRMLTEKDTFTLGNIPCVREKQGWSFMGWGCEKEWIMLFVEGLWTASSGCLDPWLFTHLDSAQITQFLSWFCCINEQCFSVCTKIYSGINLCNYYKRYFIFWLVLSTFIADTCIYLCA